MKQKNKKHGKLATIFPSLLALLLLLLLLTPDWSGTCAPCPLKLKNSESPPLAPELSELACQRMFARVGHWLGYGDVSSRRTTSSSRNPKRLTRRWRRQDASLMHPWSEAEGVEA